LINNKNIFLFSKKLSTLQKEKLSESLNRIVNTSAIVAPRVSVQPLRRPELG